MTYTVDKDIPMPIDEQKLPPLNSMETGDSIQFPIEKRQSVQTMASRLKREQNKTFKVKKVNNDYARVWRIN